MTQATNLKFTRKGAGSGAISPQAFLTLYTELPHLVEPILGEMAANGDIASLRAAMESGLLEAPESKNWSYTVLPILCHPHNGAEQFVREWLRATGGDDQSRLDRALLGEMDPLKIGALMRVGARIGPEDSNGENALTYAINQENDDAIDEIIRSCNANCVLPMISKDRSILNYSSTHGYSMGLPALSVLGECQEICDQIRSEAGKIAMTSSITDPYRLKLMEIAKMPDPASWDKAFKESSLLAKPDTVFFTDLKAQAQIIKNMLAAGVSINHRFLGGFEVPKGKDQHGRIEYAKPPVTLLQVAANYGDVDMVARLLDAGANPNYKSGGKTARDYATSDEVEAALNAFSAKKSIDFVVAKSRVEAILYGSQASAPARKGFQRG